MLGRWTHCQGQEQTVLLEAEGTAVASVPILPPSWGTTVTFSVRVPGVCFPVRQVRVTSPASGTAGQQPPDLL